MCINPITIINPNTKEEIKVKCGKCILCRRNKCRTWALRLYHESQYFSKMCMITLTFSPEFLCRPIWKTLTKIHKIKRKGEIKTYKKQYQTVINPTYITDVNKTGWLVTLFIKKLRKELSKSGKYIEYFAVGEHGTKNTHRAHWHILIYGLSKEDLCSIKIGNSKKNKDIYYSKIIEKLWNYKKMNIGMHTISDVTTKTVKYVANYTMKKLYNNKKNYPVKMRFSNMAKIGTKWARKYHKQLRNEYLEDGDKIKYSIPKCYYNEMIRYKNSLTNASMNETAEIIEQRKDEIFNKLKKEGKLEKEYLEKKAKKLIYYNKRDERDF